MAPALDETMTEQDAHELLSQPLGTPEVEPVPAPAKPRRGRPPGARNKPRPETPGAPPRGKPRAPRRPAGRPDYVARITEALQIPAAILAIAGTATGSDALMADSVAMANYAPAWGDALGQIAADKPEFAAALDKMLKAGPYGAVLAVGIPFGLQIAANHGWMKPATNMGVVPREDLLGTVKPAAPADDSPSSADQFATAWDNVPADAA